MITEPQIIEAAKECALLCEQDMGETYIPDLLQDLYRFAQHFYRQGLLDAAEKLRSRRDPDGLNHTYAEAIRQMAEEVTAANG